MKAIIMAGGEGTRLRPLTCSLPKTLVPLLNKPTMAYTVDLLRRAGIYDIGVTLAFEPQKIVREFGASLRYFVEDKPLGTAGSVRAARDFLTETFVVISGDALTDVDLNQAIAFHRRRGAMATMVLCHADDPQPYGGVLIERDGRVKHFIEKPDWAGVASDLVNTGIYILEPEVLDLIPEGKYDFGRELFPAMVQQGKPLYGHVMQGYWCDIGDIGAYYGAQWDLSAQGCPSVRTAAAARYAQGHGLCSWSRPAVLAADSFIGDGAQILAGTVIGDASYRARAL
jgi:mannose-1-phosphate guanylyltransferase/phosphomannomutase